MNSRTIREIEEFVFQLLAVLFQLGGIFLVVGGVFVLVVDVGFGQTIAINSLGVVFLTSGIVLLLFAGLIINENKKADEEDYSLIETPVPWTFPSTQKSTLPPRPSETHSCPSCGYQNPGSLLFCQACNSELWRSGTPHIAPPPASVVERKMKRVATIRRIRGKIIPIVIIASIILAITSNLFVGYEMVNGTSFRIRTAYFQPGATIGYGDLLIAANLEVTGQTPLDLPYQISEFGKTSYVAVLGKTAMPTSPCLNQRVYIDVDDFISCDLMIGNVSMTTVLGSHMEVTLSGIIHYYLYYQTVTLSDSAILASTCTSSIQYIPICALY